jgi:hypothetical protein
MSDNPNDEIREAILKVLFSVHKKARGIKSTGMGMRKLKAVLKAQGLKEHEIVSNLDFLVQTKWVLKEVEEYPLKKGRAIIRAKNTSYKISEKGINHFQGTSKFQTAHKFENINIMNLQGVTVVGENNIVFNQHTELFRSLDILDTEIQKSGQLDDEQKLASHADIETIKSQLSKSQPSREILKTAWEGVKAAATIAGVIGLCQTVAALIAPLLA